ncbi:23S rRNA pseudouridine(2605) synthase RluB [soil metagenome]
MERLQKIIAESGICSRRAAETLITAGKVRVNGKTIMELGAKADAAVDTILVNNRPLPKPEKVMYLVYKPKGYICSKIAQDASPLVASLVPNYPAVYPVGRLDKESEGLILLTNDGELTQKLTHPSYKSSKTYLLTLRQKLDTKPHTAAEIQAKFEKGVKLSDGKLETTNVSVEPLPNKDIKVRLTIREGRNHVLRRASSVLGLQVKKLVRTEIGNLTNTRLKIGGFRKVTAQEMVLLAAPKD